MQFALVGICLILRIRNLELGIGNWELVRHLLTQIMIPELRIHG